MAHTKLRALLTASAVIASTSLLGSPSAHATLRLGDRAVNARVEDADGRVLELKTLQGKPILIVYEDRDSAQQNVALKSDLAKVAKGDRYKKAVALAAVADVSSYDFWPAKGFVKDAIRDESKKQGTTIYCDWNGSFRATLQFRRGASNVLLLAKDGRVLFASHGTVDEKGRQELVTLLRAEVETP